ncbi:hypothetical protein [Flammeovirga kamogawensis]|uniref:GIY-YIG nuclease family protein n=1 Tax=Flammeovirga kamogawensis TaxID=373891 RepID=A0ABX8H4Z6_9BACT|nr:hypothetical protein [Flammeovirga kamogawensis]MBB6463867.1 hypothetical protein [Flammeovirga kamogawensis]QWG10789.1 hypothetical protein KM029_26650 [Flammeovirga kamogawensis]TRX63224.1 hypothetical protein EO216_26580 [Flammeovirga kamogawensis]
MDNSTFFKMMFVISLLPLFVAFLIWNERRIKILEEIEESEVGEIKETPIGIHGSRHVKSRKDKIREAKVQKLFEEGHLKEIVYLYTLEITLKSGMKLGKVGIANDTHHRSSQYGTSIKSIKVIENIPYPSRREAYIQEQMFHDVNKRYGAKYYGNCGGITNGGTEMYYLQEVKYLKSI